MQVPVVLLLSIDKVAWKRADDEHQTSIFSVHGRLDGKKCGKSRFWFTSQRAECGYRDVGMWVTGRVTRPVTHSCANTYQVNRLSLICNYWPSCKTKTVVVMHVSSHRVYTQAGCQQQRRSAVSVYQLSCNFHRPLIFYRRLKTRII